MERDRRLNWREKEVHEMLNVIKRRKLAQLFDGTNHRNIKIYESIADELNQKNIFKTAVQVRSKFKTLKLGYYKMKRKNNPNGSIRDISQYVETLEEILRTGQPDNSVEGVDTSTTSSNNKCVNSIEDSENLAENSIDTNSDEQDQEICHYDPIDTTGTSSQKEPKKKTHEEVVASFLNEYKKTQEDMIKSIKDQDEVFFKYMNEQRKFEEELLRKDREETAKLFKSFIEALTEKSSQYSSIRNSSFSQFQYQ